MKKTLGCGLAAALSLAAGVAMAQGTQGPGYYLGGALGATHLGLDCGAALSCDRSDTGGKLFGGYRLGNGLAVELSYFDYGRATGSAAVGGLGLASARLKGTGYGLGLAYFADITPAWTGIARAGVARNKAEVDATGAVVGSASETSTRPYFGLGLGYKLTPALSLDAGLDYTRFRLQGESSNARMLSLGLRYAF